jgi:hypothetical protein
MFTSKQVLIDSVLHQLNNIQPTVCEHLNDNVPTRLKEVMKTHGYPIKIKSSLKMFENILHGSLCLLNLKQMKTALDYGIILCLHLTIKAGFIMNCNHESFNAYT